MSFRKFYEEVLKELNPEIDQFDHFRILIMLKVKDFKQHSYTSKSYRIPTRLYWYFGDTIKGEKVIGINTQTAFVKTKIPQLGRIKIHLN